METPDTAWAVTDFLLGAVLCKGASDALRGRHGKGEDTGRHASRQTIYRREELAKVADYLSKYRTDATFAIGYTSEGEISISARSSKGIIDVGEVMRELGGGGSPYSAATKITGSNIEETGKVLTRTLKPRTYIKQQ